VLQVGLKGGEAIFRVWGRTVSVDFLELRREQRNGSNEI